MVSPFEVREDGVVWRGDGETLSVQAWGDNSLRTRSMVMGDIEDSDFSLLPPRRSAVEVSVELGSAQEGERLGQATPSSPTSPRSPTAGSPPC